MSRFVPLDLARYETIEWDDEDDPDGNLAHCSRPGHLTSDARRIVAELISEDPVQIRFPTKSASYAFVGPCRARNRLWVVLFVESEKRGDWIRPVTGWPAEVGERREWEKQHGRLKPI